MEKIIIRQENNNIDLYLDKNNIIEVKYNTNLNDFTYYLNFFKLSNNNCYLSSQNGYDVYLDNISGLKHYLKNGIDDLEQLFFNNGYETILFMGNPNLNNRNKPLLFRISNFTLVCTLTGLLLFNNVLDMYINKKEDNYKSYQIEEISDYSIDDIKRIIFASPNLTDEEKEYLFNEDFFSDILPYINKSEYLKYQILNKLTNLKIQNYGSEDSHYESSNGYYDNNNPNVINVKSYKQLEYLNKDTVAHEWIHLWQESYNYNLITEASAEIIANEYYDDTKINCYYDQVRLLKKLMETIGSEPIWIYNFTGDFSKIEERVRTHLNSNEYHDFLNCLSFDFNKEEENRKKWHRLNELIGIIYQDIYGIDINEDKFIKLINIYDRALIRYYFNRKCINNSYYYDYDNGNYMDISYEEATQNGLINIFAKIKIATSKEETEKNLNTEYGIVREIDYSLHSITITRRVDGNNKTYITGFIDGIKYEEADLDELVDNGIINVNYYLVRYQKISYEEYKSNAYQDIVILHSDDTILKEDSVYGFVVPKIYIPSVDEKYKNASLKLTLS